MAAHCNIHGFPRSVAGLLRGRLHHALALQHALDVHTLRVHLVSNQGDEIKWGLSSECCSQHTVAHGLQSWVLSVFNKFAIRHRQASTRSCHHHNDTDNDNKHQGRGCEVSQRQRASARHWPAQTEPTTHITVLIVTQHTYDTDSHNNCSRHH